MTTARKPTAAESRTARPSAEHLSRLRRSCRQSQRVPPSRRQSRRVSRRQPAEDYRARYLDEIAPANIVGRMIKFSKDGKFFTPDDEGEIIRGPGLHRAVRRDTRRLGQI